MISLKGNVLLLIGLASSYVAIDTGHYNLDKNTMG